MAVSVEDARRIIEYTAKTESGGKFNAWNPDDTGAGISFGLIQFNQAAGRLASRPGSPLAALLKEMHAQSPDQFDELFRNYKTEMLDEAWVKSKDFNNPAIKTPLLASAAYPAFQTAQLELARKGYFVPAEATAEANGIKSERGHAMLFDTSVQWGPVQMNKFAQRVTANNPGADELTWLQKFAELADDNGKYNRRHKILNDSNLSDAEAASAAIGVGSVVLGIGLLWFLVRRFV